MSLKLFFSLFSSLFLISCQSKSLENCSFDAASKAGFEDGSQGLHYKLDALKKNCRNKEKFEKYYLEGLKMGLEKFCSYKRGQEQAALGLNAESMCSDFSEYQSGHHGQLKNSCTPTLAWEDAKNLLRASRGLCLSVKSYKKNLQQALTKYCNAKKAYKLGYEQKNIDFTCKESPHHSTFLSHYQRGMRSFYQDRNIFLKKEIKTLQVDRKGLKESLKSFPESQQIKIDINKIESKILKAQHEIENNLLKLESL